MLQSLHTRIRIVVQDKYCNRCQMLGTRPSSEFCESGELGYIGKTLKPPRRLYRGTTAETRIHWLYS